MIYTGCDLQIAVFLLLLLFWTTTKTPPPKRHHTTPPSPPLTTLRTPSSTGHATTLSALERVRERGRMARGERRTCGVRGFSRPFFPRLPGVDQPPVRDRALPSWRRHGTPRRGGGAENGAEQRGGARRHKRRTCAGAHRSVLGSQWSVLGSLESVVGPEEVCCLLSVLRGLSARCLLLLLPLLVVVFLAFFFFLAFLAGPCGGTDGETRQRRW